MTIATHHESNKYLTFVLGPEEYGIPISKVKEIIGMTKLSQMPNLPAYIRGVINLRDHIIPIVDLRCKFSMPERDYTDKTCIIILEIQRSNSLHCKEVLDCDKEQCPAYNSPDHRCWMIPGTHCKDEIQGAAHEKAQACQECRHYKESLNSRAISTVGVIVDGVSEVATIPTDQIEDPPSFSASLDTDCLTGIAKDNGKIKILLDIDRTVTAQPLLQPDTMGVPDNLSQALPG